jgi:hypothetical protein
MDIEIKYTTKTEISNKINVTIYFGDKYLFKIKHLKTAIIYKSSPCIAENTLCVNEQDQSVNTVGK